MKRKRGLGLAILLSIVVSLTAAPPVAASQNEEAPFSLESQRFCGSFDLTVSPGKVKKIGEARIVEAGDGISVSLWHTPSMAEVDIGLVDSDNVFYYFHVTESVMPYNVIIVPKRDRYTLAIRNSSPYQVDAGGFVEECRDIAK